ncbi:MAG TPA: GAF domain-containing protein [Aggregatilineaceae bacterium]|nr:GAF domain-containing protein [Aggregatilineaceae bacterium]
MRFALNSLRARISLIVLLSFLPAFVLIIWTAEDQRRVAIEKAEADVLNLTQIITADNKQYISSTYQLLTAFSQLPAVRNRDSGACSALFADLLDDYTSYSNFGAVDTATGVSFCSGLPMEKPIDVSETAWYQKVLQTQDFLVSEYRIGLLTGLPTLTMALPVRDDQGSMQAVVTASLSLRWLDASLQEADLPSDTTITLLDKDGIVLARHPGPNSWIGKPFYNQDLFKIVQKKERGTTRAPDAEDTPRLYGFSHMGPAEGQISVVVGFPERRILADAKAIRNRNIATLVGISLTVIVLTWIGSSVVLRPIKSLIETSRLIAAGELKSRTKLNTNIVELEQLLHAFNEMANSVEKEASARMDELAATNEQLRYEIDERAQAQAQTKILQELTASLSEAVTSEQVEAVVVDKGLVPVGSHFSVIALYDENTSRLKLQTKYPVPPEIEAEVREMELNTATPLTESFVEDKTIWVENLQDYEQRYPILFQRIQPIWKTQSFACLPLWSGKKKLGGMLVSFPAPRSMDAAFRVLLTTIADYCAQTLDRARLYEEQIAAREEAERATRRITCIQTVTAALSDALTREQVAQIVVNQGIAVLGVQSGAFYSLHENRFALVYHSPNLSEAPENDPFSTAVVSPFTEAVEQKKVFWIRSSGEFRALFPDMPQFAPLYSGGGAILPIMIRDEVVGVVRFNFADAHAFDEDDRLLLVSILQQCAQALERVELAEQATQSAAFEERQRLARDLHDAVSQTLFSATTIAESLPRQWDRSPEKTQNRLGQVVTLNRAAMAEMRALLLELRPDAIGKTELKVLLSQLIDAAKGRKHIKAQLNIRGTENNLPLDVHIAFYRIAQESINNILKHSQATQFSVDLDQGQDAVRLMITDDGHGFDPEEERAGLGMGNMRERAAAINAMLEVTSQPAQGTQVRLAWEWDT